MYKTADKYCHKCNDTKVAAEFYKNAATRDGLSQHCRACTRDYLKHRDQSKFLFQRKQKKIPTLKEINFEAQPDKVKQLVGILIENPKTTAEEMALKMDLSVSTVRHYMYSNPFLVALRHSGISQITKMIPAALEALKGSLNAASEEVRLKASVKVLENEKILGPERIDLTVSTYHNKSTEELEEIYKQAQLPPPQTISSEFIS